MNVSVIIRAYNRGYIIQEAIASALGQTYPAFEIVVVDDGSTDDTSEVVDQLRTDRIRYIKHDTNRGVSAAGNTGIKASTGDVVAHLDTDDLWQPEMLTRLVAFLDHHPEVGAVFCDVEVVRKDGSSSSLVSGARAFQRLLASHIPLNGDEWIFTEREMHMCLLEEVPIAPPAALIRRSVLDQVGGYDEKWLSGEDWELYLRIAKHYRFGYLNQMLTTVRVLEDSTLARFWETDKDSLRRLISREKHALRGDREARRAANRAIAQFENDLGWVYLHSDRRAKSISAYCRGFAETGDPILLLKAASAVMPLSLRSRLKSWRSNLPSR
jgi:glycosyltransferase involved in cell wall biosynthesis